MPSRSRRSTWHPAPGVVADRPVMPRPTTVTIDAAARRGQPGLGIGDHVTIQSTGLYNGEVGRIERFAAGAIPAAVVRTESGKLRHVRTIDLARSSGEASGQRPEG